MAEMEREIEIRLTSVNVRGLDDFFAVPGIHVLFLGPAVCMRHGFADALRTDYRRLSHLCISEVDMVTGLYLQRVDEAVRQIATKGDVHALIFKAGCQNAIIGTDYRFLTGNAESKYGIQARLYEMNKMSTKRRRFGTDITEAPFEIVFSLLKEDIFPVSLGHSVNLLGSIRKLSSANELPAILSERGYSVKYLHSCESYEDFQAFKGSALNLVLEDGYRGVAESLLKKFGIPYMLFYDTASVQEVKANYRELSRVLNISIDTGPYEKEAWAEIRKTVALLGDASITVKAANYFSPLKFARDLTECGFKVGKVLKRQMFFQNPEQECQAWLEEHVAGIEIGPEIWTMNPPIPKSEEEKQEGRRALPGPFMRPSGEDHLGFSRIRAVMEELRGKYEAAEREESA